MSDFKHTENMLVQQIAALVVGITGLVLELSIPGYYLFLIIAAVLFYEIAMIAKFGRGVLRFQALLEKARKGEPLGSPQALPSGVRPMAEELLGLVGELKSEVNDTEMAYEEIKEKSAQAMTKMNRLVKSFTDQRDLVAQCNQVVTGLSTALGKITSHADALTTSAEESSSSILEMTMTNEEVAENMTVMSASVRDTVSSIDQMAHSIKESAESIDALSSAAEETSSSMTEIDRTVDQVQSNANETAKIIADVAVDAERGTEAIAKTLETINRIKDSSQEASDVISSLGQKIGAIGHILNVIDDVAEQTNLLALNAAIIAAQAGEHGKGFAVVADEIKELSERTGVSTKEIADLIKSIQAESKNAIEAVEEGNRKVDEGVKVSAQAEQALVQIRNIAKKSTEMMNAIARATVEQSFGSKQVTDAISRIAENVQQIAQATQEQARGSELIISGAETMRSITQHVERSTAEQANGGRQITKSIESISKKVRELNTAYHDQKKTLNGLSELAMRIHYLADEQNRLLTETHAAMNAIETALSHKRK